MTDDEEYTLMDLADESAEYDEERAEEMREAIRQSQCVNAVPNEVLRTLIGDLRQQADDFRDTEGVVSRYSDGVARGFEVAADDIERVLKELPGEALQG